MFDKLLNDITTARNAFDNNRSKRYTAMCPSMVEIDNDIKYIRINEDYVKYSIYLETLRSIVYYSQV